MDLTPCDGMYRSSTSITRIMVFTSICLITYIINNWVGKKLYTFCLVCTYAMIRLKQAEEFLFLDAFGFRFIDILVVDGKLTIFHKSIIDIQTELFFQFMECFLHAKTARCCIMRIRRNEMGQARLDQLHAELLDCFAEFADETSRCQLGDDPSLHEFIQFVRILEQFLISLWM